MPVPAIAVALEHPIVVSVVAVHTRVERLRILPGGLRLARMIEAPVVPTDRLFSSCLREFFLRFQPEMHTIPGRLAGGFPFVEGTKLNAFAQFQCVYERFVAASDCRTE